MECIVSACRPDQVPSCHSVLIRIRRRSVPMPSELTELHALNRTDRETARISHRYSWLPGAGRTAGRTMNPQKWRSDERKYRVFCCTVGGCMTEPRAHSLVQSSVRPQFVSIARCTCNFSPNWILPHQTEPCCI